jgi:U3 small nucleolar RNA-associated protein 24
MPSAMFLSHNTDLGPPYKVLVDTNFINFSLQNKLELVSGMMDCLSAKSLVFSLYSIQPAHKYSTGTPCITDCVLAELEKLGPKYRIALRIARSPAVERLPCSHQGTYADDCLVQRVTAHRCYLVATCDRELRRRLRQIPGVPLMYIAKRKMVVEKLMDGGI